MIGAATRSLARLLMLAALTALGACSTADTVVFKGLVGEAPGEKGTIPQGIAEGPIGSGPPAVTGTVFRKPVSSNAGPPSLGGPAGTLRERALNWKARVYDYDDEFQRLRRSLGVRYAAYSKAVEGFGLRKKKLLPENDANYRKNMAAARAQLRRVNADLLKLNAVASKVALVAGQGEALTLEIKGADGKGGVKLPAVQRKALAALEKEVKETVGTAHKMQAAIQADIVTHSRYSNEQWRGLDQLAAVVEVNPPRGVQPTMAKTAMAKSGMAKAPPRPFVRIRFARARVAYKRELYAALKAALAKRPDLYFELVGATRSAKTRSRALGRAQEVMFAMAEMGVPPTRMKVTAVADTSLRTDEVRLYAR
jgi:hypothetical protein